MSRIAGGDRIEVKPSNNVYTALAAVGMLAVILAIIVLFVRASTVLEQGLL